MEYTTIGKSCSLVSGGTPSRSKDEYWRNGTIPWIKIGNIKSKYVNGYDELITEQGLNNSSAKLLKKGTILYTIFATLGEVGILDIEACTNQAIVGISINDSRITTDYLYYYLKSKKEYVNSIGRGVAQNNINLTTLKEFEIPLIDVDKQLNIVKSLEKTEKIIDLKKNEIDDLDLLIKARFVEMFGDMYLNSKGWSEIKLESMADVSSGITKGRKTKGEDLTEVPYMAVSNVKDGYIDWTTIKTIRVTQNEIEKYRLLPNDVLITEGGDPDKVGRGAIIKDPLENCIHQNHIFRVRLNESVMLPVFFSEYLQHQRSKSYFLGCAKQTTGIASINMKQLRALPVQVPPLSEQEKFALFKEQVDKSKLAVQKSLEKTQQLFDSLMQEYFG